MATEMFEGEPEADHAGNLLDQRGRNVPTDNEEAFLELMEAMAKDVAMFEMGVLPSVVEDFVREDEFTCRSCHLVLHRTQLADPIRRFCDMCTRERARPMASAPAR